MKFSQTTNLLLALALVATIVAYFGMGFVLSMMFSHYDIALAPNFFLFIKVGAAATAGAIMWICAYIVSSHGATTD